VAPYLALLPEKFEPARPRPTQGIQRLALHGENGAPWRFEPHDLPPWAAVYQGTQRWLTVVHEPEPPAVVTDRWTSRSSPGERDMTGPSASGVRRGI